MKKAATLRRGLSVFSVLLYGPPVHSIARENFCFLESISPFWTCCLLYRNRSRDSTPGSYSTPSTDQPANKSSFIG